MSGSHSSSDDSNDSRKRPPDEVLYPDTSPKRPNCDDTVHLKVLIPSIAAGAVIGKSGEAIGKIQKETNTKVKISKQDEFYPGTTERVCLIVGSIDGVMCVHNYIMDRILEKPDPNPHATCEGRLNVERHKQVKILVPNSTAGMVIGKGGTYIQDIKDKTGAYVQISQKSRDFNLLERCVIIAGDLDQTRAAVQLILTVIAADPQSASYPNLSYQDVRGPVASVYPTGSPYATPVVPCPINPNWIAGSSLDPATATAAAMIAAFSPRSGTPVGTVPAMASPGLSFFHASYPSASDLVPLTALASSNQTLGLAPVLHNTALSNPSGSGDLIGPGLSTQFNSTSTLPAFNATIIDPNAVMAAATHQAALISASFRSKPQLLAHEMQQLTDSSMLSAALLSQNSLVTNPFRMPSSALMSYQTANLANPSLYAGAQTQQSFSRPMTNQSLVESHSSPPSGASGTSSAGSSPSVAASVALAALSAAAAAGGASTTPSGLFTNPGALLGMLQSPTASAPFNIPQLTGQPLRPDTLSLPNMSPTSQSLFLSLNEGLSIANVSTALNVTPPIQSSVLNLYSMPNTGGPSLSTSPIVTTNICKQVIPVPENVIGLILGPQGRSLMELQTTSSTLIHISQKGVYVPGTHNRMVTITGLPNNVQWAATVIEQRVAMEQLRRESGGPGHPTTPSLFSEESNGRPSRFFHQHPSNSYTSYTDTSSGSSQLPTSGCDIKPQTPEQPVDRKLEEDSSGYHQPF